ncbi:hypothetical protein [Kitasatospora sp. NPDC056184]|uniref:hypothetical protein n=1 Tax=Kitasatospora sp. NPDC056184 TaxID=3345738 RepID=UPI0035DE19D9
MTVERRDPQTFTAYKAERRGRAAGTDALSDYDAELSARVVGQGIPHEWPACTCGADHCPDKGAA